MNIITTLISIIVWIACVVALIYTLYRAVKSDLTKKQKIFWIIFIFLFPYGALGCAVFWIFYIIRKTRREHGADREENTYIPTYSAPREYESGQEKAETEYKSEGEVPVAATESDDYGNVKGDSENSENGKIPY